MLCDFYGGGKENVRRALENYLLPMGIRSFAVALDELQSYRAEVEDFLDLADDYGLYVWISLPAWGYTWAWGSEITQAHPETASIDQDGNVRLDLSPVIDFYDILYPYFMDMLKTAIDIYGSHQSLMGIGTNPYTDYPFYSGGAGAPYTWSGIAYGYNPTSLARFVQTKYFWRDVNQDGTHVKDGSVCKIWQMFVAKTANCTPAEIYSEWNNYHGTWIGEAGILLRGLNAYYSVDNAKLLQALYDYVVSYTGKAWLLKHPWHSSMFQVPAEAGIMDVPSYSFCGGLTYHVENFLRSGGVVWFNLAHTGDTPFRLPTEDELKDFYLLGLPVLADSQFHEVDWRASEITQSGIHAQYALTFGSILNKMRYVGGWFGKEKGTIKALWIGASGWAPQFFTTIADIEYAKWEDSNLTRFGDFSKFNVLIFGGSQPSTGQITADAVNRIKAFVNRGGGIVFVSSGGSTSWVNEILAQATIIMDSSGVYAPDHAILKPYGSAVYPTYKGTIAEAVYGSGRAIWIDLGYPGLTYIGGGSATKWRGSPSDSVLVLVSNALLHVGKQDSLIPAWWHTKYGAQPWSPLVYYSITGKPDTPKLLWLTNAGNTTSPFEIHLNATYFNIDPQGWIAIDIQNWQVVAKGNGTDIRINTTIPAKSWKPIYITNTTSNLKTLYSNQKLEKEETNQNTSNYTINGLHNQTAWLLVNSTKNPTTITLNNKSTIPPTSLEELSNPATTEGWNYNQQNNLLLIKF
ncbi:MAG: hypothetical protein QW166_05175, partial [Candidatus Bathyarchaeia archaeon]